MIRGPKPAANELRESEKLLEQLFDFNILEWSKLNIVFVNTEKQVVRILYQNLFHSCYGLATNCSIECLV